MKNPARRRGFANVRVCGIQRPVSDPTIERIEAELRESRTQAWDVETFLANRYQAKIEAIQKPTANPWMRAWSNAAELFDIVALHFGRLFVVCGIGLWVSWMIYG